ncbi:AbrB family transcriptional regulator [Ensifer soli]|uniref:AbrB family transcriptional regulator n=1 Tax=Ciceribacter sp. sgz301302 TaxID=3342379 RepID=UPI0035BB33A0
MTGILSDARSALPRLLLALAIAALGGMLFFFLHLPLAFMLGAMAATATAAILGLPVATPRSVRPPMTALIGVILGSAVTPDVFDAMPGWTLPLALLPLFLLVSATVSIVYFRRVAGLDLKTAYFCGMPGGLVEMVLLGAQHGADERTIALVHALRVFLVVLILPFFMQFALGLDLGQRPATGAPAMPGLTDLAWVLVCLAGGSLAAHMLRLPLKFLLGPLLFSLALHLTGISRFHLPDWVAPAAQVVLGATIGCRFGGIDIRHLARILALCLGSVLLLLAVTAGFAALAASLDAHDFTAMLLAYSPGGLAEMSLVAYALHVEVMFVFALHVVRVVLVAFGAALVFRLPFFRETP